MGIACSVTLIRKKIHTITALIQIFFRPFWCPYDRKQQLPISKVSKLSCINMNTKQ